MRYDFKEIPRTGRTSHILVPRCCAARMKAVLQRDDPPGVAFYVSKADVLAHLPEGMELPIPGPYYPEGSTAYDPEVKSVRHYALLVTDRARDQCAEYVACICDGMDESERETQARLDEQWKDAAGVQQEERWGLLEQK